MRTCKTVLYTMVKVRNNKVLESLTNLKLPKDSLIVDYILKTLRHLNNTSERNNGKYSTPHDELDDIFKLIGQHEMMDQAVQQLYKFKIKYPDIDIEPHISKTTKYFQDCIHRRLSAIENNLKNEIDVNFKSVLTQKSESAATSEAEGFMKRLQTLKMKASVACRVLGGKLISWHCSQANGPVLSSPLTLKTHGIWMLLVSLFLYIIFVTISCNYYT